MVSLLFATKHPSIHYTTYSVWLVAFTRFKERSRVGAVAVLNVNVRHDTRKHFLHWQHSSKLLPSLDLAVVSDGMNTDEFYTVTWKRWGRKMSGNIGCLCSCGVQEIFCAGLLLETARMRQKHSQGSNDPEIRII